MANCENCIKSDVCMNYEPKSYTACTSYLDEEKYNHKDRTCKNCRYSESYLNTLPYLNTFKTLCYKCNLHRAD